MGTDTPEAVLSEPAAADLRLLQPAVRAGHQPAAGRDPGGGRHLAVVASSARRQNLLEPGPCVLPADRAAVPGAGQRRPRQADADERGRQPARLRLRHHLRPVRRRAAAPRRWRNAIERCRLGGRRGDRRRRPGAHAVRPALHRRPGADPVPAADLRGAPAPGAAEVADQGRARRRVRRRPRGAPHRAAARLRRRRGEPVPGAGDAPRTSPGTACSATSRPRRPSRTLSTPSARACSR